jgi:ATP-dependent Clp protease ATP-binding subunit ClpC
MCWVRTGLDLEKVRMEVEKPVGIGPEQKSIGNIPYTPRVKKVLAFAAKEAAALNHTYVGTDTQLLPVRRPVLDQSYRRSYRCSNAVKSSNG